MSPELVVLKSLRLVLSETLYRALHEAQDVAPETLLEALDALIAKATPQAIT